MPAKVPNPRKQFQFGIILAGLNPFLAQEVKLPDNEFDSIEHGDTNHDIKTAGKRKVGNLTVNRILPADSLDVFMKAWIEQIQSFRTGGGDFPSNYKRSIMVEEYSNDNITVIERHIYDGCFPLKVNGRELSRKGSENTMENIEFSVDEVIE